MDYLEYKNYLAHHGIEGQKWGRRRFQNEDGSLTPEGRAHYGVGEAENRGPSNTQGSYTSKSSSSSAIQKVPEEVYGEGGKKKMSPETKKKILIGAGITAGVLAATGVTVYAVKNGKAKNLVDNSLESLSGEKLDEVVNKSTDENGTISLDKYKKEKSKAIKENAEKAAEKVAEKVTNNSDGAAKKGFEKIAGEAAQNAKDRIEGYGAGKAKQDAKKKSTWQKFTDATGAVNKAVQKVTAPFDNINNSVTKATGTIKNTAKTVGGVAGTVAAVKGTVKGIQKVKEREEKEQIIDDLEDREFDQHVELREQQLEKNQKKINKNKR